MTSSFCTSLCLVFEYLHGPKEQKHSFKNPGIGSMCCESDQCRVEFISGVMNVPACVFFCKEWCWSSWWVWGASFTLLCMHSHLQRKCFLIHLLSADRLWDCLWRGLMHAGGCGSLAAWAHPSACAHGPSLPSFSTPCPFWLWYSSSSLPSCFSTLNWEQN